MNKITGLGLNFIQNMFLAILILAFIIFIIVIILAALAPSGDEITETYHNPAGEMIAGIQPQFALICIAVLVVVLVILVWVVQHLGEQLSTTI